MDRLNEVRNRLCHPLRLIVQPITFEDKEYVLGALDSLSSLFNSHFDVAKDPILIRGNSVRSNSSALFAKKTDVEIEEIPF